MQFSVDLPSQVVAAILLLLEKTPSGLKIAETNAARLFLEIERLFNDAYEKSIKNREDLTESHL